MVWAMGLHGMDSVISSFVFELDTTLLADMKEARHSFDEHIWENTQTVAP
jgi:hypothetical protein